MAASRAQNLLRNYYGKRYKAYPVFNYGSGERMLTIPAKKATQPAAQNNVKVYPNPAGSYVTFAFKAANNDANLNLYIYSATGLQMYQSKLDPVIGQQVVLVNTWTNGIYGYSIRGTSNKIGSGTFVISH